MRRHSCKLLRFTASVQDDAKSCGAMQPRRSGVPSNDGPMFAWAHKQTVRRAIAMSILPLTADICWLK
jgi:hypothetical protein